MNGRRKAGGEGSWMELKKSHKERKNNRWKENRKSVERKNKRIKAGREPGTE